MDVTTWLNKKVKHIFGNRHYTGKRDDIPIELIEHECYYRIADQKWRSGHSEITETNESVTSN